MYLPEEFVRRAAECQQMAKATRIADAKAAWIEMADRWLKCAQQAERYHARRERPATRRSVAASDEARL